MIKHMQSGMRAKTHNRIRGRGIMKSETNKESKYPMTYEEFKERVIELFLASTDSPHDLEGKKYLLNEYGDDIIRGGNIKWHVIIMMILKVQIMNSLMKVCLCNQFVYLK